MKTMALLARCLRVLGWRLGWRYWRVAGRARRDHGMVAAWAFRCRREAIAASEPYRSAYLKWAEELEAFKAMQDEKTCLD